MYGYKIFHEETVSGLLRAVRTGVNPHAFMFIGERGRGKTEAARLIANALVCEKREAAPCGICNACRLAKAGTDPDIIYVRREKDKKTLGVDVIRGVNDDAAVKPFGIASKVYIIPEAELMTAEAQNAFLKTLEEPPLYAVFILICNAEEAMLPTVLSRCTKVSFAPVTRERLEKFINDEYPSYGDKAKVLSVLSEGSPEFIRRYAEDESFRALRSEAFSALRSLLSERIISAYAAVAFAEEHSDNISEITDIWLTQLRDIMLINTGLAENVINTDMRAELQRLASVYDTRRVIRAIECLAGAKEMQKRSVGVKMMMLTTALKIKEAR